MRVPEQLPDINQPRYEKPLIGPIIACIEGVVEVPFLGVLSVITSWLYLAEYFTDNVVVPRYFDLIGVSVDKIYYKGIIGAYDQGLYYSCHLGLYCNNENLNEGYESQVLGGL